MAVNRCNVSTLIQILSMYNPNMNVAVLRHPDYCVSGSPEFDGIKYFGSHDLAETMDVYVKSDEEGQGEPVLILSATMIEELWEEDDEQDP